MKNCIVIQSGGPTAAINASLAGVIKRASEVGYDHAYGGINGIVGVLSQNICDLTEKMNADPDFIEKLKVTPAMYLGSCRLRLPDPNAEQAVYESLYSYFRSHDIETFFGIGGNDSMDTVMKLASFFSKKDHPISVIGIPKTIDNDLLCTDHTPGFGSAAKYVAATLREMAYDTMIYPVKSITIVEVMGRDSGWLTAAAALARTNEINAPQLIYLPEVPFSIENCIADTRSLLKERNSVLIAVSEGVKDANGDYISAADAKKDKFGHAMLSGAGKALEHILGQALGVKIRSVELNIPQRCAAHLASKTDLDEAFGLAGAGVDLAEEKKTGLMATMVRESGDDYRISYGSVPVSEVANGVKSVPRDFINERGNDVTDKMVKYLKPLIQGEVEVPFNEGLPDFIPIPHLQENAD